MGIDIESGVPEDAQAWKAPEGQQKNEESEERKEVEKQIEIYKKDILKELKKNLSEIMIGSEGGEEIFDEPDNLEEITNQASELLDQAYSQEWDEEELIEELAKINTHFNEPQHKENDDVSFYFKDSDGNSPLGDLIHLEMVTLVYNSPILKEMKDGLEQSRK